MQKILSTAFKLCLWLNHLRVIKVMNQKQGVDKTQVYHHIRNSILI